MPLAEQRAHARLAYDHPSKSSFLFEDQALDVVDLSERGLRFRRSGDGESVAIGEPLCGILCLRHGETVPVAGRVVRVEGQEVAAWVDEIGIPYEIVLAERLYLDTGRTGIATG